MIAVRGRARSRIPPSALPYRPAKHTTAASSTKMRIRPTACLLATTSLVGLARADTQLTGVDSNQIIQFLEDDFRGDGPNNPNASIFSAQRYNTLNMKLFHWGAREQQVSAVNIVDGSLNVRGGTGIKAVRGLVARQTSSATPPGDVPNSLPPIPMTCEHASRFASQNHSS